MSTGHDLLELASVALACRDSDSLLKIFAARATSVCDVQAALVWLRDPATAKLVCAANRSEIGSESPVIYPNGKGASAFLQECCETREVRRIDSRESLSSRLLHLEGNARSQLTSALYAPIHTVEGSLGVVELLRTNGVSFTESDAVLLEAASRFLGQSLKNLQELADERQSQLFTVERLTTLYDLGRTFTSSLELSELLPVIGSKICRVMEAAACNLWLVESGSQQFCLAHKTGNDATIDEGARVSVTEGVFAEVAHRETPKLLELPAEDSWLATRFQGIPGMQPHAWMCAPLRKDAEVLGVIEVLNRSNGEPFTEDDLFFLASISEQAAVSIHNAKLLESERKVYALDALLKISQEITSTLDLKHVLTTVANQSGTLFRFDRFVIGYYRRGQFVLGAVSGEANVPQTEEIKALRKVLEGISHQDGPVSAELYDDGWHLDPEFARVAAVPFLEASGYSGFYGVPLRDDQGPIGVMALLSANAEFLGSVDREILAVLANQTTVAIRNSQLYEQSPFRTLLGPLASKRQYFRANTKQERWLEYAKRTAIVVALFAIIPWPLRVSSNATIVPAQRRVVSSVEGGVVERVGVKEGDVVQPGSLLAQLNDSEDRIKLAQAQEALEAARRELGEAEFRNDPSAAGQAKLRVDLHLAEVQLEQKRVNEARVLSPIAGIVVTPKVEEKVGTMLKPGDAFAEVVEQDRVAAELSVPEPELPLIAPGETVALKLNAFPTLTLHGTVERVGAQSRSESNEPYFLARAVFPNPGGMVKDGMVGRARARSSGGWFHSGWYPLGYVLLRAPSRWLWMKLWTLLP
jgi:GAF domain-containing protein/multidrug resistance efflux pump